MLLICRVHLIVISDFLVFLVAIKVHWELGIYRVHSEPGKPSALFSQKAILLRKHICG